ncbi:MAG TPA: family 1 glycosylhydrolase, partial [Candidatus Omnitrophota bacterium]|nr:family 1 glycosylhydrolase [Candidatus Omnitrophota bacterium]
MLKFPDNFLWGAATASHQVEGNNTNNDWWAWERSGGGKAPSGAACGHYERYREDFDLARSLGNNCHRFSLEWSRIEPAPHSFSPEAISHYKDVLSALRGRRLEPIVTLHHFTSPLWFSKLGGFSGRDAVDIFCTYVERVVSEYAGQVTYWVTINEPLIYLFYGYVAGDWPPNKRSIPEAFFVWRNLIRCHVRAYKIIHKIYREKGLPPPRVSIAHHMPAYYPCTKSVRDK